VITLSRWCSLRKVGPSCMQSSILIKTSQEALELVVFNISFANYDNSQNIICVS
jgi:hypothetical protein